MRRALACLVIGCLGWPARAGAAPPEGIDPEWGWETLLDDPLDDLDARHPSWDVRGGRLGSGQAGSDRYGILGESWAHRVLAGSESWTDYALAIRFRVEAGTEFAVRTQTAFVRAASDQTPTSIFRLGFAPAAGGLQATAFADTYPDGGAVSLGMASSVLTTGAWHLITILRRGARLVVYADGVKELDLDVAALSWAAAPPARPWLPRRPRCCAASAWPRPPVWPS